MNIAVIPARGGSKRIPRKNVKSFCGRPIIRWTIDAALQSECFDHVIVSTDDEQVAEIARAAGATVPFVRPQELSGDHTTVREVVIHAVNESEHLWGKCEFVCCIYATAAFVLPTDITAALHLLRQSKCDFALAVTTYAHPIQRALRIVDGARISMMWPEHRFSRSQDLEPTYHDAGQFYWGHRDPILENRPTLSEATLPIVVPRYRAQDIDTPEDWLCAELMWKALGMPSHTEEA